MLHSQTPPASATLARLRETLQQARHWVNDADVQAFLRAEEALIEGDVAKPKE